ncbi:MAG: transposase [Treponema sp.]|jgi:hypothetical protein|nr:transposase [Treponema sp.]
MTGGAFKIAKEEIGETLSNFNFIRGDLAVADQAYGTLNGMKRRRNRSADCFAVCDENGNKVDVAGGFAALKSGEHSEAVVFAALPDKTGIPARVCVKRKDKEACEKSRKRLERRASRKGGDLREKTVAFNEFIVVATSPPDSVGADETLETYRRRRRVEMHFKRLKSIMDFGDLPKQNPAASEARLNGKIMVALSIEAFIAKASFSPATESNAGRGLWRETASVHLVLKTDLGLRTLEDCERIAKRLECEKRKRGIRRQMCNTLGCSKTRLMASVLEQLLTPGEHWISHKC